MPSACWHTHEFYDMVTWPFLRNVNNDVFIFVETERKGFIDVDMFYYWRFIFISFSDPLSGYAITSKQNSTETTHICHSLLFLYTFSWHFAQWISHSRKGNDKTNKKTNCDKKKIVMKRHNTKCQVAGIRVAFPVTLVFKRDVRSLMQFLNFM